MMFVLITINCCTQSVSSSSLELAKGPTLFGRSSDVGRLRSALDLNNYSNFKQILSKSSEQYHHHRESAFLTLPFWNSDSELQSFKLKLWTQDSQFRVSFDATRRCNEETERSAECGTHCH